ncbi:MAG: FHA domain-containing protein [Acidobacteriota bacterium]|nr:FHA domain-containing protein [Acidobacteriota bacterium]
MNMNRVRRMCLTIPTRRATITLTLLVIAAAVAPALFPPGVMPGRAWSTMLAHAQDDPMQGLSAEYEQLEREGLKENFIRRLSYTMLQEYLPPGTRFTSGYRSPEKQLDLILRMAKARGIPTSDKASVGDESSWRPALMSLRANEIIIAAPTTTPHGTDEAVFDLSGADLNSIQAGLRRAEKAGMVEFTRIIFEPRNNAVHVEVKSISPKALNFLGRRRGPAPGSTPSTPGAVSPPQSEDDQRRSMLQQLQNLHDREPDPTKQSDYDRSRKNLLDPIADAASIKAIDAEIREHQKEVQQLAKESRKKAAVDRVSEALRDDRYDDAEREAAEFAKKFPGKESQRMLARIKTYRLVNEAMTLMNASNAPGCGECERAGELIDEALTLYPNHDGAQLIKQDIDACLEQCESRFQLVLVLGIFGFVLASSIIGAYFWSRSGTPLAVKPPKHAHTWVLEGIEGAGRGQVFPLNKGEMIIGSHGPPDGTADIVICDAQRKISRRHCSIMQNGKQFYLMDESTNGTKINDRELTRGVLAEFRNGDHISLADEATLVLRPQ